jgi:hypothetical protein
MAIQVPTVPLSSSGLTALDDMATEPLDANHPTSVVAVVPSVGPQLKDSLKVFIFKFFVFQSSH